MFLTYRFCVNVSHIQILSKLIEDWIKKRSRDVFAFPICVCVTHIQKHIIYPYLHPLVSFHIHESLGSCGYISDTDCVQRDWKWLYQNLQIFCNRNFCTWLMHKNVYLAHVSDINIWCLCKQCSRTWCSHTVPFKNCMWDVTTIHTFSMTMSNSEGGAEKAKAKFHTKYLSSWWEGPVLGGGKNWGSQN